MSLAEIIPVTGAPAVPMLAPDELDQAGEYLRNTQAGNTARAYASHWRSFETFCDARGVPTLPASWQTVVAFLTVEAKTRTPSTLTAKLAAIAHRHRAAHHPNPCDAIEVREYLKGIRRTKGTAPRRKRAATLELVARMVATLPDDLRGKRDRALLLVGFFSAMRRSELAAVRVEHISFTDDGARILIERSKTDQEASGRYVQLEYEDDATVCPVLALREWIDVARIGSGHVFRGIDMFSGEINATPITGRHIGRLVKDHAARIGEAPHEFGAHSLRAGFVTSALEGGANTLDIREQTGHKSDAMIAVYARMQGRGARRALRAITRREAQL